MAGNTPKQEDHPPVADWDDGLSMTTYANAAQVSVSRGAIGILFGVEKARQAGQEKILIEPTKQFSLSPSGAKRLAAALKRALEDPATSRHANEALTTGPSVDRVATPSQNGNEKDGQTHLDKIIALFRHLGSLDSQIDLEHSFKTVDDQLLTNRFLLGIRRHDVQTRFDESIASVCERIGMPERLQASFKQTLSDANHVYFGVEKNAESLVFKAYLEYRDKIENAIRGVDVSGRSFPLFTGFKWDTSSPSRQAVTDYAWYPALPVSEILEHVEENLEYSTHSKLFDVMRGILQRISARISDDEIQYLEVTEEDYPRRSFDINLYKAGFRLMDIYPFLWQAMQHYAIPSERFQPFYERIKTSQLGHLAGGIDRQNRDFMTVYYGVQQIHSSQLRSAKIIQTQASADNEMNSAS